MKWYHWIGVFAVMFFATLLFLLAGTLKEMDDGCHKIGGVMIDTSKGRRCFRGLRYD